jgi:uncharacterized protein YpmS
METYNLNINHKDYILMVADRKILVDAELHINGREIPLAINSFPPNTEIMDILRWANHVIKSHD